MAASLITGRLFLLCCYDKPARETRAGFFVQDNELTVPQTDPPRQSLWINLSKSGASVSAGRRGATAKVGKKGVRSTVGLPGTGLSYQTRASGCLLLLLAMPAAVGAVWMFVR
jgi:Protein of unknown function (DUF4236)